MRGTYHIAGGLAILGLGRACVTVGEGMGQSQATLMDKPCVGYGQWGSAAREHVAPSDVYSF